MKVETHRMTKNTVVGVVATDNARIFFCAEGLYWLTREGDYEDYFLWPGEALTLRQGNWVAQAMRESVCTVSDLRVRKGEAYAEALDISFL